MKILNLFDVYFLSMMVIQGSVVVIIDAKNFKKSGDDSTSKKARILGSLAIIIAIILFMLRSIF
ncbi:CLC_0170 family protein [Clostridium sp.]|uniref:CLC_0170 family protein n=1 Tax=Clostridium sp. TaxID=1506 RepID=UPI003D6CBD70